MLDATQPRRGASCEYKQIGGEGLTAARPRGPAPSSAGAAGVF